MCSTCASIGKKIEAANASGDRERERIMRVLLANHHKHNHPQRHNVVVVNAECVVWPDGTRWVVEGADG